MLAPHPEKQYNSGDVMPHTNLLLFALLLGAGLPLSADVTIRYTIETQANPATAAMMGRMAAGMPGGNGIILRVKGTQGYTENSLFRSVTDFTKGQVTVIDTANRQYATVPSSEYVDAFARAVPKMPAAARESMAAMKTNVESRAMGKTATIAGMEAEETEITMTMDLPSPNGAPAGSMKMVMHVWSATQAEVLRRQSLRELAAYSMWMNASTNATGSLGRMFEQMGTGDGMKKLFEQTAQKGGLALRVQTEMYMPFMAAMLARGGQGNGAAVDPNAPVMQMTQEVAEFSDAPVPDSVFQIPEGYQAVPIESIVAQVIVRGMTAGRQ